MGQPRTKQEALHADTGLAVDAALEAALWVRLGTFPRPIYVVPPQGAVGAVSGTAEAALASDRAAVERRLVAIARSHVLEWHELQLSCGVFHLVLPRPRSQTVTERVTHAALHWALTPRQTQVCQALVDGHRTRRIASMLGAAVVTVEKHISAIFAAAGVSDRPSLMLRVLLPATELEDAESVSLPGTLARRLAPPSWGPTQEPESAIRQALAALESSGWGPVDPMGRAPSRPERGVLVVTPITVTPELLAQSLATRLGASEPERRVLALLLRGKCNKEIASDLGCAEVTVEGQLTRLFRRTRTRTRYQLIVWASTQPPSR
ncbi:MAG: helix-turn-helix domain-containing protein [Sandaracinaceae bacterium]|nr:MAG: helix-turn-helix domain-containing protein [Sandaracinaceae bacterium]